MFTVSVLEAVPLLDNCTCVGFSEQVGRSCGVLCPWNCTLHVSAAVPAKPFWLLISIAVVADCPDEATVRLGVPGVAASTAPPCPLSGICTGEPGTLDAIVNTPVRAPAAVGVKLTCIWH